MDYYKYINTKTNFPKFQPGKNCTVPFCVPHVKLLKSKYPRLNYNLTHTRFDKWYKYPRRAHKLYWKFHSTERELYGNI